MDGWMDGGLLIWILCKVCLNGGFFIRGYVDSKIIGYQWCLEIDKGHRIGRFPFHTRRLVAVRLGFWCGLGCLALIRSDIKKNNKNSPYPFSTH